MSWFDGKKTYIVAVLVGVAALASYFGSFTQNETAAAFLLGLAALAVTTRKAIEAK
jgi:hypothetical protein